MTTKPNEPEGLEPCPLCGNPALVDADHRSGARWAPYHWVCCSECGCKGPEFDGSSPGEAIAAWNRRTPAQPVADAGGVTDADRELHMWLTGYPLDDGDSETVRRIIAHRLQSVAAATAAKDAEVAELAEAVRCIMARCEALEDEASNGIATTSANVRDDTHEAGFWRGQKSTAKSIREHLHDMTRAALSEAREAGAKD